MRIVATTSPYPLHTKFLHCSSWALITILFLVAPRIIFAADFSVPDFSWAKDQVTSTGSAFLHALPNISTPAQNIATILPQINRSPSLPSNFSIDLPNSINLEPAANFADNTIRAAISMTDGAGNWAGRTTASVLTNANSISARALDSFLGGTEHVAGSLLASDLTKTISTLPHTLAAQTKSAVSTITDATRALVEQTQNSSLALTSDTQTSSTLSATAGFFNAGDQAIRSFWGNIFNLFTPRQNREVATTTWEFDSQVPQNNFATTTESVTPRQPSITQIFPIRERIVERVVREPSTSPAPTKVLGVSQAALDLSLNQLSNTLKQEIYRIGANATRQSDGNFAAIALTQRIDQLNTVAISNATISGSTFAGSVAGTSGSFSGGVSGTTGTFSDILSAPKFSITGTGTSTILGDSAFDTSTLYVDSVNHRVGIATTSPTDIFSVNGPIFLGNVTPAFTLNRLYANANNLYWAGNLIGGATTGNWVTDGTNAWRATGNVGIGTTTPSYKLTINSANSTDNLFRIATTTAQGILTVNNSGNVGIGTTTPSAKLDVVGDINISAGSAYMYNSVGLITASTTLFNYFFGELAGNLTMTGTFNIAIGNLAFRHNTTGFYNTAIGYSSLHHNTTGYSNTANGLQSLLFNTTGFNNTANGSQSLQTNTTGSNNTATGLNALFSNTTGNYNTATGLNSLYSNTTGNNNTTNGVQALYFNTTGSNNTVDGMNALLDLNILDGTGNNTALGYNTGRGIVTGINNTILGANVTGLAAGLSNNIIIADGAGNRRINVDSTGNVGIGTTTPSMKLAVEGSSTLGNSATAGYFTATTTTNNTFPNIVATYGTTTNATSTNLFGSNLSATNSTLTNATSTNSFATTASSTNLFTSNFSLGSLSGILKATVGSVSSGLVNLVSDITSTLGVSNGGTGTTTISGLLQGNGTSYVTGVSGTAGQFPYYNGTNTLLATSSLFLSTAGNVGIGTTAPSGLLDIGTGAAFAGLSHAFAVQSPSYTTASGNATAVISSNDTQAIDKGGSIILGGVYTGTAVVDFANIAGRKENGTAGNYAGYLAFSTRPNGFAGAERMRIDSSGNVGIGTTGPGAKLDVVDNSAFGGNNYNKFTVSQASDGGFMSTKLSSLITNANVTNAEVGRISSTVIDASASPSAVMAFHTVNSGTLTERMRITNLGNVGIGTTTPTYAKLLIAKNSTYTDSQAGGLFVGNATTATKGLILGLDSAIATGGAYIQGVNVGSTWDNLLLNPNGGNVGINNTAPRGKLEISEATDASLYSAKPVANTISLNAFDSSSNGALHFRTVGYTQQFYTTASNLAAATEKMRLTTTGGLSLGNAYVATDPGAGNMIISGNVGIGTTGPGTTLDIAGTLRATGDVTLNGGNLLFNNNRGIIGKTSGGTNKDIFYASAGDELIFGATAGGWTGGIGFRNGATDQLFIKSDGSVGIGTTAPGAKLHVNLGNNELVRLNDGANASGVNFINGSILGQASQFQIVSNAVPMVFYTGATLNSMTAGTERMRIDNTTGNVGIGTTAPTSLLALGGTAARTIQMERNITAATAGQGLTLSSGGAIAGTADLVGGDLNLKSGISTGLGTSALHFFTATAGVTGTADNTPTEKLTILGNGNVGIGTTAPGALLHLSGSGTPFKFNNAANDGFAVSQLNTNSWGWNGLSGGMFFNLQNSDFIVPQGKIGIGTTVGVTPTAKLDILDTALAGSGSLAGSVLNLAQTWNTTGTPTAIKLNVTNTASNAASLLMDLQVGGVSQFKISNTGSVTLNGLAMNGGNITGGNGFLGNYVYLQNDAGYIRAGAGGDTYLTRAGVGNWQFGTAAVDTAPVAQKLSVQNTLAGGTADVAGANFTIAGSQGKGTGVGGSILFQTAPAGSTGTAVNALATAMTILGNSNVGIGTATPKSKLTIVGQSINNATGDTSSGILKISTGTGGTNEEQLQFGIVDGSYSWIQAVKPGSSVRDISLNPSGGNVGIGTTTPSSLLNIAGVGTGVAPGVAFLTLTNTHGASQDQFGLNFINQGYAGSARINSLLDAGGTTSKLQFLTGGATPTVGMTIDGTGNLGIGTTTPSSKLAVSGGASIGADYNIAAPTNGLIVEGNVGIGTNAPGQKLDIVGNININSGSGYMYNGLNVITAQTALYDYFFGGAGNLSMTGNLNVANGFQALFSDTSGSQNTASGHQVLYSNTSGNYNTANGTQALYYNTTGSSNTAVGLNALMLNTTGINNTGVGRQALYDLNILDGTGNNTALGYNTGRGITTGINNTIIGANVTGLAAGLSNNIIIADGSGNQRINVSSAGNVGIGTTTPSVLLEASGATPSARITGTSGSIPSLELSSGGIVNWNLRSNFNASSGFEIRQDSTNRLTILSGGNVGIGTTGPLGKLQVTADVAANPTTGGYAQLELTGATTPTKRLSLGYNTTGNYGVIQALTNAAQYDNLVLNPSGGNIGIATTTPWRTLSVVGTMAINGLTTSTAGNAVCITAGFEVVTAGNTTCVTSSLKTKKDILAITSDEAQHDILSLVPSVYTNIERGDRRFGFIAEQANTVDARIVEYASEDRTLPSGLVIAKGEPSGFDYLRYPAVLTKFVQDMYASVQVLTTGAKDIALSVGSLIARVASLEIFTQNQVTNGITTKDQLTGEYYCVFVSGGVMKTTRGACSSTQVANVAGSVVGVGTATSTASVTISIQGNNPATIKVGDRYGDLGATITAPTSALNLGIKASVDGGSLIDMSNISIDTMRAGVHHIVYTVIDQNNATTTAERILNVGSQTPPPPAPVATSTSPTATSTPTTPSPVVVVATTTPVVLTATSTSPSILIL